MPRTCPAKQACGTNLPVWMDDQEPTTSISTRKVCARYNDNCCALNWNIRAKKCVTAASTFFVYELRRITTCSAAYCAGDFCVNCMSV